jgi:hypothetical protein
MMRGRWLVILFILLLGACLSSATATACPASTFITNAGNAFMGAARVHSASAFSGVTARYTDLRGISMFALGPHRKLLSKSREAEYLTLTRVSNGKKIIFKLHRSKRGFLVRDVNISSVWLAQQLRSTFVGVINRNDGDINALFAYLRN